MSGRLLAFMIIMPVVWVAVHLYLGRRLINGSGLRGRPRRVAWGAVATTALWPPMVFWAMREVTASSSGLAQAAVWVGFSLMGLSSIVLVLLVTTDLLRLGRRVVVGIQRARMRRAGSRGGAAAEAVEDPSRRAFFGRAINLGIVGSAGTVTGVGVVQARQVPDVVEVDVPIAGLPAAAEGLRIVQISDVHVGPTIHGDFLAAVVDQINALDPDIVAVTGDLVDGWVEQLRDELASLARLRARHGVFFVTGNHEYYWDGPAWCEEVARLGATVLVNEHRVIEHDGVRILLAGATDSTAGGMVPGHASDPGAARRGAPRCDVDILLAHQPRSIYAAAEAGYHLQLSGHTHGGQYFPMNVLVYLAQPYVAGLHRHDDTWIYVSRGTGYWGPPVRMGAPHEITLLRLTAA